jgi:hypothetical protein
MKPIVTIIPNQGNPQAPDGKWPWLDLGSALDDPVLNGYLQSFLEDVPDEFATVQLKQFRNAPSTAESCYQAVVATSFAITHIDPPSPLPPVSVTVATYESLDIPGGLGLPTTPIEPLLQYSLKLDMSVSGADNLFVRSCCY